jgi:hypothetical protein
MEYHHQQQQQQQKDRMDWERTLISSGGTLLVEKDDIAVKKWGEYILYQSGINLNLFATDDRMDKENQLIPKYLVYLDGYGDLADIVTAMERWDRRHQNVAGPAHGSVEVPYVSGHQKV